LLKVEPDNLQISLDRLNSFQKKIWVDFLSVLETSETIFDERRRSEKVRKPRQGAIRK
jgi:hypothetical protein